MLVDEAPAAADAEIDLADRDGVAIAQPSPPLPDVLGPGHGLVDKFGRRVEEAREADLGV
jgi:hypothetical protein